MNNEQTVAALNKLSSEWSQFKIVNDRRMTEIERKGSADPITLNQLEKLQKQVEESQSAVRQIKTALERPEYGKSNHIMATKTEDLEHKTAFCGYLRKGNEAALQAYEAKSLSHIIDSDSGYLITSRMSEHIDKEVAANSPVRCLASVESISTDALEIIEDKSDTYSGWTASLLDYNKISDVILTKRVIPVHESFAQLRVTQKILDDPRVDIESWLAKKLTAVFIEQEGRAFIHGNGEGKPRGLLACVENKDVMIASGRKGEITSESLINMFYSLKEQYSANAKFLLSRDALQHIRMLKSTGTGQYLWQPNYAGDGPDTLLGAEVVECAQMPKVAPNALAVVLADFKQAYQIVDRSDIRVLRDPYTDKPFIKYYATKKVGADVINTSAIRILKLA